MDALGESRVVAVDETATPIAFVNHVFAVVDAETARAIETSPLLHECADFEVKRIEADGGDCWTGRYLSMRTTYVELFGPHDAAGISKPGSIGIALGGDVPGIVGEIDRRLKAAGHRTSTDIRKRRLAGREVDWFRLVGPPDAPRHGPSPLPTVDVWSMEYLASYVDLPEVAKRPSFDAADAVSRLRYNAGAYRDGLLSDLDAAHFAIERTLFVDRVRPYLLACGLRPAERDDGAVVHSGEGELQFTFVDGPEAGLRELRFRLNRRVPDTRSETIGRSLLVVGPGDRARWTFAP